MAQGVTSSHGGASSAAAAAGRGAATAGPPAAAAAAAVAPAAVPANLPASAAAPWVAAAGVGPIRRVAPAAPAPGVVVWAPPPAAAPAPQLEIIVADPRSGNIIVGDPIFCLSAADALARLAAATLDAGRPAAPAPPGTAASGAAAAAKSAPAATAQPARGPQLAGQAGAGWQQVVKEVGLQPQSHPGPQPHANVVARSAGPAASPAGRAEPAAHSKRSREDAMPGRAAEAGTPTSVQRHGRHQQQLQGGGSNPPSSGKRQRVQAARASYTPDQHRQIRSSWELYGHPENQHAQQQQSQQLQHGQVAQRARPAEAHVGGLLGEAAKPQQQRQQQAVVAQGQRAQPEAQGGVREQNRVKREPVAQQGALVVDMTAPKEPPAPQQQRGGSSARTSVPSARGTPEDPIDLT